MPFHEKGTKACREFFSILIAGKCGLSSGLSGNDVDRKVESICMETKQHATRIAENGKISGSPGYGKGDTAVSHRVATGLHLDIGINLQGKS